MSQIVLTPIADARIRLENPTTNYGSETSLSVGEANSATAKWRSLVKFGHASLTNLEITSAKIRMRVTGDFSSNARNVSAYILRRAWEELQVTWNNATTAVSWGTAGAGNTSTDRYSTAVATTSVPANPVVGDWYEWSLDLTEFKKMIDGTYTNYGFVLQAATETDDDITYSSREGDDPPQLVVEYTPKFVPKAYVV